MTIPTLPPPPPPPPTPAAKLPNDSTLLSEEYAVLEGTGPEPYAAYESLKEKIKLHYDLASDYYLSLWGEHIHHGYFTSADQSKESAQLALIDLLLQISSVLPVSATPSPIPLQILDVGCGIGGTSRDLAMRFGCHVTGVTISSKQVEIATKLSRETAADNKRTGTGEGDWIEIGEKGGRVRFIELDAEKMGTYFMSSSLSSTTTTGEAVQNGNATETHHHDHDHDHDHDKLFDVVWISEALSHFPDKQLFFRNACKVLQPKGRLVVADWFRADDLNEQQFNDDIKPIERGMLLPPLCKQGEYVSMAEKAGLRVCDGGGPKDISSEVSRTWDISWSLVQNPSLWAFAFSQGRDGLAFLQAFRAMRRGYTNETFRYAVMAFEK